MPHDGAGDAAKQRPPHRPIGTRPKHEQVHPRASRIKDRRRRIATHQDLGLDRDSVTERLQRSFERAPRRQLLTLERLTALDRDERLEAGQRNEMPRDRRRHQPFGAQADGAERGCPTATRYSGACSRATLRVCASR